MRVLVYPHLMELGGSQLNAVELANGLAQRGHDIILFAPDGQLVSTVRKLGLEYIMAPESGSWPSIRNMRSLCNIVHGNNIDVVHGFEWGPSVELAYGPHRRFGTPMVTTVLSMSVPDFLPTHETIVVGTAELLARQKDLRPRAFLMEPPVDTELNAPVPDHSADRVRFGFVDDDLVVSVVCRLTTDLGKLQGILEAISAVDRLAGSYRIKLVVAGDGAGLRRVSDAANVVNARHGFRVIFAVGGLLDPRPAYAAADVVLGMGSSALKGMAFGKPLVVQGDNGFWRLMNSATLPTFLAQGFYGYGGAHEEDLALALKFLAANPEVRAELGALGRSTVESRYSLSAAVRAQEEIYRAAILKRPTASGTSASLRRTALELAKFKTVIFAHNTVARTKRSLHAKRLLGSDVAM